MNRKSNGGKNETRDTNRYPQWGWRELKQST